ncbi:MAG: class II aldolase/adducin family protein [Candidatus Melainabacteria bacterium]|nr:class II aldolase/adducin family protein [Candidatus Melainabacteria bacterium]
MTVQALSPLTELTVLSKYAGERFDWIQAGGGNTSIKTEDGALWVKASGVALSEVHATDAQSVQGLCCLDNASLMGAINLLARRQSHAPLQKSELEAAAQQALLVASRRRKEAEQAERDRDRDTNEPQPENEPSVGREPEISTRQQARPSIETWLHAQLGTVVLHTHPLCVTALACQPNWQMRFEAQLANVVDELIFVPYATPGIELALVLQQSLRMAEWTREKPAVIILQNHGLITSGPSVEAVLTLTETVTQELTQQSPLYEHLHPYRLTNQISGLVDAMVADEPCISWLCEDRWLNEQIAQDPACLNLLPLFPDQLVYCGPEALCLETLEDNSPVLAYKLKHRQYPRVVRYQQWLFTIGKHVKACREIESVLKAHLLTYVAGGERSQPLSAEEMAYLMGWEAEHYRQQNG